MIVALDPIVAPRLTHRRLGLTFPRNVTTRIDDISRHARLSPEHVVFQSDSGIERHIILNFHIASDLHPAGHQHILSEIASSPDHGPGHDVSEMPDLGHLANITRLINIARFVHKICRGCH